MDAALAYLLASLTGNNAPPSVQTDPSGYTASNPTGPPGTAFTKAWPLLSGTPAAGTVYQLDVELTATWAGNGLALGVIAGGTFTQFSPSIGAPSFTSPDETLAGWLRLTVRVASPTTARFAIYGAIGETEASTTPGGGSMPIVPLSYTLAVAAGDTVALAGYFGASNASQGLASYGSTWTTVSG